MMKRNLRKGFGDRKRGAMRNEERIEHGKRRTRSLKRKCKFRILCYAKISHSCEYPNREHGFENLSQKRIRTRFTHGSHSCEIRIRDLGRDREHVFLEIATKAFSHKGCVMRKFRITGNVVRQWLKLVFFLPCFALLSP